MNKKKLFQKLKFWNKFRYQEFLSIERFYDTHKSKK
jgi:hypothetical protein